MTLHRRRKVAVEVKGHSNRRQAEPLLDDLRVHALAEQFRRVEVPQVVKACALHAGSRVMRLQAFRVVAGWSGATYGCRKDEVVRLVVGRAGREPLSVATASTVDRKVAVTPPDAAAANVSPTSSRAAS